MVVHARAIPFGTVVIVVLLAWGATHASQASGPAIRALRVPAEVASEATVTGTIELTQAVPQRAGAVEVALESSNSSVAEVTATVEIAPGTGQASFTIHAHQVNPDTTVVIKARLGRQTVQASMLVRKPNYTPPPKSLP